MKKCLFLAGVAFAALALAGTANAETAFSGNVALTTDYHFRGISQTGEDPALQGGFDATHGLFYAGVWGSTIDFPAQSAELEVDVYAGFKPVVWPVTLDLGVIGYLYPSASDDGSELDYVELKAGASFAPTEQVSLTGNVYYSPEFTLDGGDAVFVEGIAAFTLSETIAFSGGVGNQSVDAANYFADGTTFTDSYTTWNLGGTLTVAGFGLDLRYVDTDLDSAITDERVIFTIKRAI